ncbi:MAG TPA: ABC transporter ATP-binding protein [Eubacteriaceae bacterium]|nr:ABC transporter ATP-binding protein [Eubacteriaceae bacterium]
MNKESTPLIEIRNLSYEYGQDENTVRAIEDVDLSILPGEFICVLGPSGCGKSTLLNILAGYLSPTEGSCTMNEEPIVGPSWHRGVVFQSPTLYPWLNVRENVEFGPKVRGISKEQYTKVSDHYLKEVRLTDFAEKPVFELSGGMKQRIALARALANEPSVVLMDEPFGALDALTRTKMQALVRTIWQNNNSTFFLITHDIDEALALGTRVVVMSPSPGKIVKTFDIDFTNLSSSDDFGHVHYNEDYIKIKDEILDLIHFEIDDM